ncbi:hypothetical protein Glove_151g120 [Diversispora epigaea]|uniref:Uncharacterized protein n=1 Tax=Diversispora epigaea TaxID=1348612 RepID=A0A397J1I8_9GLOM|nr:hypothetical protein Glove_151g120 [Diversispora epigaea]
MPELHIDSLLKNQIKSWINTWRIIVKLKIIIVIQIKEAEEFSKNQTTDTTITPKNYKTNPQAIYTKLTASFYRKNASDDNDI